MPMRQLSLPHLLPCSLFYEAIRGPSHPSSNPVPNLWSCCQEYALPRLAGHGAAAQAPRRLPLHTGGDIHQAGWRIYCHVRGLAAGATLKVGPQPARRPLTYCLCMGTTLLMPVDGGTAGCITRDECEHGCAQAVLHSCRMSFPSWMLPLRSCMHLPCCL